MMRVMKASIATAAAILTAPLSLGCASVHPTKARGELGELVAARVDVEVDRSQHRTHPLMRRTPVEGTEPATPDIGQEQVFGYRQVEKLRGPLMQNTHAPRMGRRCIMFETGLPPIEGHPLKLSRLLDTGHDLDHRGLAGTIDPDKPVDAPRLEPGRDVVNCDRRAVAFGHARDFECRRPFVF